MDMLILWFLSSVLAAGITAYLRLLFTGRPPEPFWFAPLVLFLVAIILVLLGGANATTIAGPVGQLCSAIMIAFGGWMLLGWRR